MNPMQVLARQIADIVAAAAQADPPHMPPRSPWWNVSLSGVQRAVAIVHFGSSRGVDLPDGHVLAAFTLGRERHAEIIAALGSPPWIEDNGIAYPNPADYDRRGLYFTAPPNQDQLNTLRILSVFARGNCLGTTC